MEQVERGHPGLPEVAMALDGADGLVQRQVISHDLCSDCGGAWSIASQICSMTRLSLSKDEQP